MTTSQFSFRRLLLIGLFGVTFPVLVIGVYMTYIKASAEFFKNSQQNLTENARDKASGFSELIKTLKINLLSASDSASLRAGSLHQKQEYINQLSKELPSPAYCLQLRDISTEKIIATSCKNEPLEPINHPNWAKNSKTSLISINDITTQISIAQIEKDQQGIYQKSLLITAPIYDLEGNLIAALTMKSKLLKPKDLQSTSAGNYTVIVNEQGMIVAHPNINKINKNINTLEEKELITKIIKRSQENSYLNAIYDGKDLIATENYELQLIAGYGIINKNVIDNKEGYWFVVVFTKIDSELGSLEQIHQVLLWTMMILFGLQVVLMVYLARTLGRPIDKLKDYALHIENFQSLDDPEGRVPKNFSIKEFNQLSEAFEQMLIRLKQWGKELEKAWENTKSANELKDMFLATISHELRTPLNGIMGSIQLVKDNFCDDEEEEKEFLDRAHQEACRLLDIIDDILDISKIQEGKLSVNIEPVDLIYVIKDVIECQKISITKKGLQFNIPVFKENITIYADEQRFRQVLVNVIGNATKFTEHGSITLTVEKRGKKFEAQQINGDGNEPILLVEEVVIKVVDTGIGVEPNQQAKLFRPFVMVDGSSTRKYRGSGLGLAISKFLMEEMGGTIQLFSEGKDKGTTVEIVFPLCATATNLGEPDKIAGMTG